MNNNSDPIKEAFYEAVVGRTVTTKGIMADHDEALSKAGAQQIWDYINGAGLEVARRK